MIVDLHCDTISRIMEKGEALRENSGQFDLNRAKIAGIGVQFFALFTMPAESNAVLRSTLQQIERYYREVEQNIDLLRAVKRYEDVQKALQAGKIAAVLHLEGAEAIGNDLDILYLLYRLGLRSIGLTWNHRNQLADGIGEGEQAGGLSRMGRKVVKEVNRLGMLLDLAHISDKAFFEALECSSKPVIVSHANVRTLCRHPRNLSDIQLKALAENYGIIGINQVADFVGTGSSTIEEVIDHIAYVGDLIGIKHVALGSDFDGADDMVFNSVNDYVKWEEILSKRGFVKKEIAMILHDNALRVMEAILE